MYTYTRYDKPLVFQLPTQPPITPMSERSKIRIAPQQAAQHPNVLAPMPSDYLATLEGLNHTLHALKTTGILAQHVIPCIANSQINLHDL